MSFPRRQKSGVQAHLLLDNLRKKLLIAAHSRVQLIVRTLHGDALVIAEAGKRAGEDGDGDIDGGDSFRVGLAGYDAGRGPDGEPVGDGPILDGVREVPPLLVCEAGWVCPARE